MFTISSILVLLVTTAAIILLAWGGIRTRYILATNREEKLRLWLESLAYWCVAILALETIFTALWVHPAVDLEKTVFINLLPVFVPLAALGTATLTSICLCMMTDILKPEKQNQEDNDPPLTPAQRKQYWRWTIVSALAVPCLGIAAWVSPHPAAIVLLCLGAMPLIITVLLLLLQIPQELASWIRRKISR